MLLDIYFENQHYRLDVPKEDIASAKEFFDKMDRDMDAGWQMGPEFIENPDTINRAQIAASRLLIALENQNEAMVRAMSGYIVSRVRGVSAVRIDAGGQMLNTRIITDRDDMG